MDEMLTVKQWAEKVGITLNDYSGFVEAYERLVPQQEKNFLSSMKNRFDNAGDILCTRRAFSYGIFFCSMIPPKIDQWEEKLEFIPEFIEESISAAIFYALTVKNNKKSSREKAEHLLRLVKLKIKAIEKLKEFNGRVEDINVDEIGGSAKKVKKYDENEEEVLRLFRDIVNDLEVLLQKKIINSFQIPSKKIKSAHELNRVVMEKRKMLLSQDEYMYIEILGQPKKDPFIQTYTELGPGGNMRPGVVFDFPGVLKGSLPITQPIKDKIDEHISDARIGDEEAQTSLVVIDDSVPERERKTFMSWLEGVVKKIINSFNRDGR